MMLRNTNFGDKGNIKNVIRNCIVGLGTPIKLRCYRQPKRRKLNSNNFTTLKNSISVESMKKIKIGNYTYGPIDVKFGEFDNSYMKIGNYCLIATEVEFICGIDHHIYHFSNYPFGQKCKKNQIKNKLGVDEYSMVLEHKCRGPIIVDDDVWIGTGAKIMSGVHIGQGAVIAAGAVVTKDIPPYAIAGGVPAKVIKYRFSEDKIKKLLQIDYSNIPIEKFREIYPETIKEDFDIDYILKKLKE